jgi:hypothetical protein
VLVGAQPEEVAGLGELRLDPAAQARDRQARDQPGHEADERLDRREQPAARQRLLALEPAQAEARAARRRAVRQRKRGDGQGQAEQPDRAVAEEIELAELAAHRSTARILRADRKPSTQSAPAAPTMR